jgi:hypothetical protein
VTSHPSDPQSRAFRDATDADRWDGDLSALDARVHQPIADVGEIGLPDDYEQGLGWDRDREPPKTLEEAREALAARIADPAAPDTEDEADAYDYLGGP